jgi:hypothetical protein
MILVAGSIGAGLATMNLPSNRQCIVCASMEDVLADVHKVHIAILVLKDDGSQLQIQICHSAGRGGRVGKQNQVADNTWREPSTPKVRNQIMSADGKSNATHATAGSAVSAMGHQGGLNQFVELGWVLAEIVLDPLKVGKGL